MASKKFKANEFLLRVSERGVISLPKEMRENIDFFEAVQREDGVIELRPKMTVDHCAGWFWTERWQRMEREADADITAGQVHVFDSDAAMLADLDVHRAAAKSQGRP